MPCSTSGHNAVTPMRLEPAALRSRVKHSTTEPLRSRVHVTIYRKACNQFGKANHSDTEAPFLDLTNGSFEIYDKRDDFNFEIVMEMFLAPLPMVYTFRNLFVLQEYILMLMISTTETHF